LVIAVVFPTSLIASWAGRHIAKYFDIDDQLVIGGFFFAALAAGVYGYDRSIDGSISRRVAMNEFVLSAGSLPTYQHPQLAAAWLCSRPNL